MMSTTLTNTFPSSLRQSLARTIVLAFADDPVARWVFPSAGSYLAHFPNFVEVFGGKAFASGTADFAEGGNAVALWLPPGLEADEAALIDLFERTVAPERHETLFGILQRMASLHPEEPHWYLPLIGVDPRRQGRGLGSMLLRRGLDSCDRERLPAYLESTNPRNRPLYERLGFQAIGEISVGDAPSLVPMLRPPRG